MIKKTLLIFSLIMTITSCSWFDFNKEEENKPQDSTFVGADKDEHGCLGSAGYTWSKICNECVRVFTGIQLNPVQVNNNEDATLCAYIIFNEKRTQAEIFLPEVENSVVLNEVSKNSWKSSKYHLVLNKQEFMLKIDGKDAYKGEAQIGNKVINSDEPETGSEE